MCGWTQAQKDPKGEACWIRRKVRRRPGNQSREANHLAAGSEGFLAPKVWGRNYTQPLALLLTCPANAVDSDCEKGPKGNPWPVGSER